MSAPAASAASSGWRILWVKSGPLHPPDTGGKIRTLQMLREINRRHEVTYLSLRPAGEPLHADEEADIYATTKIWVDHAGPARYSPRFWLQLAGNVLSSKPYAVTRHYSEECRRKLIEMDESSAFDLIVSDFLPPALHFAGRKWKTPAVLFQHNMESEIWRRLASNHPRALARFYFHLQHQRMLRWERRLSQLFPGVITVSPEDSRFAMERYGLTNVLGHVPPGVDTEFFRPDANANAPVKPRLAFLGSMDWLPNIEGAKWFASEVFPAIRREAPEAELCIIGRRPTAEIRALAAPGSAIEVTGTVDDVRPWLANSSALVVPLLSGGGTRIKILEAMAQGIPVVSTTVGAEGLPFVHGKDLLLADSAGDLAKACVQLLRDPGLRHTLAAAARREVVQSYSWGAAAESFCAHCARIIGGENIRLASPLPPG